MPERNWSRHGLSIGRQEFRRTVRALRGDRARLVLVGGGILFFGALTGLGAWLVLRFAGGLGPVPLTDGLRGSIGIQWLFAVFIFAQRAGSRHDRIDNETLMLTTVSVRSILVGVIGAELARALAYLALPVVLLGGAFAYATSSPLTIPALGLALGLALMTAALAGYAIGLTANLLVARVRFVARHKTALAGVIVVAFFGLYFAAQNFVGSGVTATLGLLPISWFADLALAGSPVVVSPARAAVVAVGSLVWIAGCGYAAERLATAYWFGDAVTNDIVEANARVDTGDASDPLAAAVWPMRLPPVAQPTRRVAQRAVVIARRNPSRLSFLLLPLVFLASFLSGAIQDGGLFAILPPLVPVFGAWLAGGAFGLNPLGDEGAVLPATLVSLASGRQYAYGLALPGLVLGLPLVVTLTALTGALGPFTPVEVSLLVVAGVVLTVAAVFGAPAVGMTFPRYDPISVRRDHEVVPPSLGGVVVYSLLLGIPGGVAVGAAVAPATLRSVGSFVVGGLLAFPFAWVASEGVAAAAGVATWLSGVGVVIARIPLPTVHWGGYALGLALALLLAVLSVVHVTRRFEDYTYD
jgi:hypothetical protein